MSYCQHRAILITTWKNYSNIPGGPDLEAVAQAARNFGLPCMGPSEPSEDEGYWTLVIPPDGTEEGSEDFAQAKFRRQALKDWLRIQRSEDRGSHYEWVEVKWSRDRFGRGKKPARITDHEWKDRLDEPQEEEFDPQMTVMGDSPAYRAQIGVVTKLQEDSQGLTLEAVLSPAWQTRKAQDA
jgi:hypothetical protein